MEAFQTVVQAKKGLARASGSPPAQVRHLSILCFSRILHALNHWLGAAWGSVALVQTWGWISEAAAGAFD